VWLHDEPVRFHRADLALLRDVELLSGGKVEIRFHAGQQEVAALLGADVVEPP